MLSFISLFISSVVKNRSDGSRNLARTNAACACIHSAGGTVDNSLYPFDVGLPCSVGSSVGVRYLDTEFYVFTAKITLCH